MDVLLGRAAPSHLPTARSVLNRMAAHFSDGRQDARSFPWHELTYAQAAELRTMLGRQYAPRTALTVEHCKGRKERVVFLPAWVIAEVDDWLDWRGHEPGPLLCRVDKHDNLYPRHRLHPDTLWERFVCHVEAAGVQHFPPTTYAAPSQATCWRRAMTW